MSYREGRFWQPDVTVATLVVRDGRLLCVEERAEPVRARGRACAQGARPASV